MTPKFAGALHGLEAERVETPKVFAMGALLEQGLSIRLAEGEGAELEEVARTLEELLLDWEKGVRGKTSGTAFTSWQKTWSFSSQVGLWQKPANFVELGRGMRMLFGEEDVRSMVVFLA